MMRKSRAGSARRQRMTPPSVARILFAAALVGAAPAAGSASGQVAAPPHDKGVSPALCGPDDVREPGVQGEVPAGQAPNYNCGVKLLGRLPVVGNVQGIGTCAYVRPRGGPVHVIDVSNPAAPVDVATVPVNMGSETMRVVAAKDRAILVSGSSVYDVRDCLHPVLLGEIPWPNLTVPGISVRTLPHDIRINHTATKVYASFGLWEADLSNLKDPKSWTITDRRCELAAQVAGPWQALQKEALSKGLGLCADAGKPAPRGANYMLAASPVQASLLWPTLSHSPDFNAADTRLYLGDQAGGTSGLWSPVPKVRIVDMTTTPYRILGEVEGAGHGLDWFRAGGREYVLHSNEVGNLEGVKEGDTCTAYPRPQSLGWAFEAYVSDVTRPDQARNVSMLQLAINEPAFCSVRKASGLHPWIAYHLIDNPDDARFAAVNFGDAGLRIFDIRQPTRPVEVAYFNHGPPVHAQVGYYDAARGLIYVSGSKGLVYDRQARAVSPQADASDGGFWVLQIEPQVRARLGL